MGGCSFGGGISRTIERIGMTVAIEKEDSKDTKGENPPCPGGARSHETISTSPWKLGRLELI
ncbi:hypothetical protein Pan216_27040 [Planctomycetes bacterium Pan216]|uniref:Uncharacterized protein n=1 Tax=Kolteria novifilia TaxID=2527975 RepID=A0A518B4C4_9BACT|nr:hypothetical protein Pan216_27040 [Planctomycetes bacterium Pan216]